VRAAIGGSALLGLIALGAGCARGDGGAGSGPRLEVRWTGADTSAFAAPATAEWCDSLDLLEIRAIAGDTGIGLAVYRRGGIETGSYPIRKPGVADTTPPAAAVGLRWFSRTAVQGFQADSGRLQLDRTGGGELSGRFTASAHALTGAARLELTGSFERLRERPATRGCVARRAAAVRSDSTAGRDATAGRDSTAGVD
jgi:hypothetical protein